MTYKVLSPIEHNLKRYEAGDAIKFSANEEAELDALLALDPPVLGEFDAPPPKPDADPDDLSAKTVAELVEIAAAEKALGLPEKPKKAELIAAIEAARTAAAAAADNQ